MSENKNDIILSVKNLKISFRTDNGLVHAVRGVSFDLHKGETLCIVGESGSGKSVTNKAIMGILSANAIIEDGQILYEGEDLVRVSEEDFHRIRGNKIGMIFQDPLSALNPLVKVGKQLIETSMINNNIIKRKYHNIIGNDLSALRNVKASTQYDTLKIKRQINENLELLKEYNTNLKKIEKDSKNKEELIKANNEIINRLNEYVSTFKHLIDNSLNDLNASKEKNKKRFDVLSKMGDIVEGVPTEFRLAKRHDRIECIDKEIALYQEIKNVEESDTLKYLDIINNFYKRRILLLKENYKKQTPTLKTILSLSKKYAHQVCKEYKKDLIKTRDERLNEIRSRREVALNEYKEYIASLPKETYLSLVKSYKTNKKVLLKEEKRKQQYQENSVSKTIKREIKLIEIDDKKFLDLIKKIEDLDKEIFDVKEDFINKTRITRKEAKKMAIEVMKEVGIPLPERRFKQYPFEFSGGMRQRIVIAIALTANPDVLICDEPTTALDVTIQAQILELINRLKEERHLSCIFITHDLGVVANMADRVAVMYAGKIVEYGTVDDVFFDPRHPYTWALLSSIPDINSKEKLEAIPGTPPDMLYPPKGDAFALRSKYAMAIDFKYEPPFFKVNDTHYAATWLLYPGAPKVEMPKIVRERIKNALKEKEDLAHEEK